MKGRQVFLIGCVIGMMGVCAAGTAPVVSNVTAAQRADASKLVDIYYDLADDDGDLCSVWVIISGDGGATWSIPAKTFTGDYGKDIPPGQQKQIIWDAGRDIPGKSGLLFKARVFADDGKGSYPMVVVPASEYSLDGGKTWVYVGTYMIDQYEVTNTQYAEYLNETASTGLESNSRYSFSMEITRTGDSGSYTYTAIAQKECYPVRFISHAHALLYAQWKTTRTGLNYSMPDKHKWIKAAYWNPEQQTLSDFPFLGDVVDCSLCNYNNCEGKSSPVGYFNGINPETVKAVSYYGCYDMAGNVWEVTSQLTGSGYAVIRGGSWKTNVDSFNKASLAQPEAFQVSIDEDHGFRLIVSLN